MVNRPLKPRRRLVQRLIGGALLASELTHHGSIAADTAAASFAFFGDMPYNALEEIALNRIYQSFPANLAFALHIGDIKSGSESCDDALLTRRFNLLQKCPVPFILLPGDNEWVDCTRSVAGSFDPIERLRLWRELEKRDRRADKALSLSRQPQWPEMVHWRLPQAASSFVGLNVPGSYDATSNKAAAIQHRRLRNAANFDWLELAANTAQAQRDKYLFIAIHANVRLDQARPAETKKLDGGSLDSPPYHPFKQALARALVAFSGQVIVLYGDTHQYRIDYPWEDSVGKRLMAVQCYGSPFNGSWLKIEIDPKWDQPKITPQAIL
jgi:hypothetical protein